MFLVIDYRLSLLVWIAMFISFALIVIFPRPSGVRTFMFAVIVRLFFSIGLEFTLLLLGIVNVSFMFVVYWTKGTINQSSMSLFSSILYMSLFSSLYSIYVFIFQLLAKGVFLVGFIGNKGTFQYGAARILTDKDLLFHLCYFGFCVVGLCINELFYSILVSEYMYKKLKTHSLNISTCIYLTNVKEIVFGRYIYLRNVG